ncbi:lysosomal amino acid transporter 1 homolog isoform X2 [Apus apus]|uniref:lysosomal amino acid transporter 1 homolog isoform X2 n=1 Tax=Apus apus TaxID=8895 RepID=UPI0021F8563C|nr:lysosomal amino acid transporter 1 homolog isoform X2 [Apus apus]
MRRSGRGPGPGAPEIRRFCGKNTLTFLKISLAEKPHHSVIPAAGLPGARSASFPMDVRRWRRLPAGNVSDCPNGSRWVMDLFNECAQDGWDITSVILGLVSIFCFAAASFPQFYQACKTGIMDRALSIYFLLGWLGGDLLNLIGSFLADQLPLQVYTAVYYVLADLVMLSLYCYYKVKNQAGGLSAPINAAFAFLSLGTVSTVSFLGRDAATAQDLVMFKGRSLLSTHMDGLGSKPFSRREVVGFTIGSISSVLYLCSRLPQIYTNYKRKSTTGVSYSLFALVMLGNLLYGLSVLLKNPDPGQDEGGRPSTHEERDGLLGEQRDSLEC